MKEVLYNIDWMQLISAVWTIVLLPVITYVGKQINETVVKDIKHNPELWTEERQNEVKELAKDKAVAALTNSMYQVLREANHDFEEYLDSLVGTALYDLKHGNR